MGMRAPQAGSRTPLQVSRQEFGWDRWIIATLDHPTLPWFGQTGENPTLSIAPLTELGPLGSRDRLSLLGQFAAHEALLVFAGIPEKHFSASDWGVIRKRGHDCRLVRLAASTVDADEAPPPISMVDDFAAAIDCPALAVLRHSWMKPEAVYRYVHLRLRGDATADLRWLRRSALGTIRAPGAEALRTSIVGERQGLFTYSDPETVLAMIAATRGTDGLPTFVLGGDSASPLQRFSALQSLLEGIEVKEPREEADIVERFAARYGRQRCLLLVRSPETFDSASRRVIELLAGAGPWTWVVPSAFNLPADAISPGVPLPDNQYFVASPRLEVFKLLETELLAVPSAARRGRLEEFVLSADFDGYLDRGTAPPLTTSAALDGIEQPRRSWLGALSLLGRRVERKTADELLRALGGEGAELVVAAGVCSIDGDYLLFADEATVQHATASLAPSSRQAAVETAARLLIHRGDWIAAARLYSIADRPEIARALLEANIDWERHSANEIVHILESVPSGTVLCSMPLAQRLADALVACGRYSDAVSVAGVLQQAARAMITARAFRRTGEYARALEQLDSIGDSNRTFGSEILRAELMRLRGDDCAALFAHCERLAATADDRALLAYDRAVFELERFGILIPSPLSEETQFSAYLGARYQGYSALFVGDLERGCQEAARAVCLAADASQKIDAVLDYLYALFLSGDWEETRRESLRALALVEESQGDRVAGGVLFTLAFLCADSGQWMASAQRITRLRAFYDRMKDPRRLREIALLDAHLEFCRGSFAAAATHARYAVDASGATTEIGQAAELILDEVAWIEARPASLRPSSSPSRCTELANRYHLLRARHDGDDSRIIAPFMRQLALFERAALGGESTPPPPHCSSPSECLKLYRSLCGILRRRFSPILYQQLEKLSAVLGTALPLFSRSAIRAESVDEVRLLRALSTATFPFQPGELGETVWRFATQNRIGRWSEIGSLPQLTEAELDTIAATLPPAWIECGERQLLFIQGLDSWTHESRIAVRELFRIRSEHHRLRRLTAEEEPAHSQPHQLEGLIASTPAMHDIIALVQRLSRRDVPVCITGESGTGKELIARAVHKSSSRRSRPFTAVNCAALPETLIESELFGHMRGAFTGADRDRQGLIEASDGGTLFLDEIGEMPLSAQAKLLRFLQEGEFRRVGDSVNRTADVRIVSATNRALERAVDEGQFREDLYYRIRGVEIALPPLRERLADIPLLAGHFLARERERHRCGPHLISAEVESVLLSYGWPGNVRELQNTIRAGHAMAGETTELRLEHLPQRLREVRIVRTTARNYHDELHRFRKGLIQESLRETSGNQNRAARLLGMSRQALSYQIRELGILVRE
jgi:DNA-binding NtrC family response regulator/tetratricopeptide (TPR) repeat protein